MLVVHKAQAPAWTPVMGALVLFAPVDRSMLLRARRAARSASEGEANDDQASTIDVVEEMGDAMSRALILEGARDWSGVCMMADEGDDGAGENLPFSRENLELALADPVTFEAFDAAYVVPFVMRERERAEPGNDSAASPGGTGGAAMPGSDTASSPAVAATVDVARRARTSSTSRGRKPKRASGAS